MKRRKQFGRLEKLYEMPSNSFLNAKIFFYFIVFLFVNRFVAGLYFVLNYIFHSVPI